MPGGNQDAAEDVVKLFMGLRSHITCGSKISSIGIGFPFRDPTCIQTRKVTDKLMINHA